MMSVPLSYILLWEREREITKKKKRVDQIVICKVTFENYTLID